MLPADFRELYRESVGTKAFLAGGVVGGIVYVVALAKIIVHWPPGGSMPSIMGIYLALPYGLGAFAAVFVVALCIFAVQQLVKRRRESKQNI